MAYTAKNNSKNGPVAGRLQNISGKNLAAVALISVMAILWGRVLLSGKSGPAAAAAQELNTPETVKTPPAAPLRMSPVELDRLQGRHDTLSGDMFCNDFWSAFKADEKLLETPALEQTQEDRHRANLEKIVRAFKLEAIIRDADGMPSQAFVNDKILTVGSVLTVKEGPEQYALVLMKISDNEVLFDWNDIAVTKKMTEMVDK
jgi:hypothetical protein